MAEQVCGDRTVARLAMRSQTPALRQRTKRLLQVMGGPNSFGKPMPEPAEFAGPMVRRRTRLHSDQARLEAGEQFRQLANLAPQDGSAVSTPCSGVSGIFIREPEIALKGVQRSAALDRPGDSYRLREKRRSGLLRTPVVEQSAPPPA
jgi:hypothetical protein